VEVVPDLGKDVLRRFPLKVAQLMDTAALDRAIQRMTPSPTALYQPMGAFRYALEAHAGFFEGEGIRAGEAQLAEGL
jgi:uncharacterized membrane protein (UPF0127 family)